MTFDQKLQQYADLLIGVGVNVQKDQLVYLVSEPIHRDFLYLLAESAYEHGARFVDIDLRDPNIDRLRVMKQDRPAYRPPYVSGRGRVLVEKRAALLRVLGSEVYNPYEGLEPKCVRAYENGGQQAQKYLRDRGIMSGAMPWTVAAAPTPQWAEHVFPSLPKKKAMEQLWEEVFHLTRIDQADPVQAWQEHLARLKDRADAVNALKIKALHFSGPGTDLTVGLSAKALFMAGTKKSSLGFPFVANMPTEEVFTAPDWCKTEGIVSATRPFAVDRKQVRGLKVTFRNGEVVDFSADEGGETFEQMIATDPGAKRLGEVALVDIASPVYQSGLVFEEILFDENAACHVAFGAAYPMTIRGSEKMSAKQFEAIGFNRSIVHRDIMISSEKVDVVALTASGTEHQVISKGVWVLS